MNTPDLAVCFHELLRGGGFSTGGLNFDAKVRRQSIDTEDLTSARWTRARVRLLMQRA
jgi:xylose isomerase